MVLVGRQAGIAGFLTLLLIGIVIAVIPLLIVVVMMVVMMVVMVMMVGGAKRQKMDVEVPGMGQRLGGFALFRRVRRRYIVRMGDRQPRQKGLSGNQQKYKDTMDHLALIEHLQ